MPTISFSAENAYALSRAFLKRLPLDGAVDGGRAVVGVCGSGVGTGVGLEPVLEPALLLAVLPPVPRRRIFGMNAGFIPVGVFSACGSAARGVRTSLLSGVSGEVRFCLRGAEPSDGMAMEGSGGEGSSSSEVASSSSELSPSSSNCGPVWLERIVPIPAVYVTCV